MIEFINDEEKRIGQLNGYIAQLSFTYLITLWAASKMKANNYVSINYMNYLVEPRIFSQWRDHTTYA